jgi:hypothetical protein
MNWAWATSLDQVWRSPAFPMWLTLAAAGFFGIIALITLLRAEKSVANGALTVITLLAIGVAAAANIRGFEPTDGAGPTQTRSSPQVNASLPALSCIDDMAGETVLTACEKALFNSPEAVAAAVSYTSARISRLTALGDVASANRNMTPELQALRRSVERDRYGLVAYVLLVRDHCTSSDCAAFRSLSDRTQVAANMDERIYDGLVTRYSPSWGVPAPASMPVAAATGPANPLAAFPPSLPPGRPTNAEFPSASSTPPVSIMNPEPGQSAGRAPAAAAASAPAPKPAASPAVAAAKKPPPKPRTAAAPVQIAPAAATPAPAASSD